MTITLSDILLRDINAEHSDAFLVEMGAHGLLRLPKSADIVAYLVLDGRITIESKTADAPIVVQRGEYALLLYGTAHAIYADARRPLGRGTPLPRWPTSDEPVGLKVGQGRTKAKFVIAALRLIHSPTRTHFENPLDDVFHLRADAEHVLKGGVLLTDLTQIDQACRGPGASAFVNTLMNLHLTHAIRCGSIELEYGFRELSRTPYLMGAEKTRSVATAVRLLRKHPERMWTVEKLAREIGMSRSTFAAVFRASVGSGPIEFLNKVRMEKAAELLVQQRLDLPLFTIASRLGFGAASSFSRAFKAHFGVAPRVFCKQQFGDAAAFAAQHPLALSPSLQQSP